MLRIPRFIKKLFQIDLSDTVDSGNISGDDVDDNLDFEDSEEEILALNSKDFDEFHVELCHGCTKSLPLVIFKDSCSKNSL